MGEVARIDPRDANVPVVFTPPARQDTDSWVEVMRPLIALAEKVYDTDFVPRGLRGSEAATAAAMLYGREVGLPPMTALNVTHVVEGKPGLSAEAMRALVFAAGHELEFVESTGAICSMRARRRGSERWAEVSWTIDMARAAGLLSQTKKGSYREGWVKYPRAMLQARCTTEICRMVFPDVIHGFRSTEELEDLAAGEAEPTAPGGSSTVQRKTRKTASKRAAADAPRPGAAAAPRGQAGPQTPTSPAGPPLPGEPGYELAAATAGEEGGGAVVGEADAPPPTPTDDTDTGGDDEAPVTAPAGQPVPDGEGAGEVLGEPPSSPAPAPGMAAVFVAPTPTGETADPADRDETVEKIPPRTASKAQMRMLFAMLKGLDVDEDREERLLIASKILGRPIESFDRLNVPDGTKLIDTLSRFRDHGALWRFLDEIDAAEEQS